MVVATYCYYEKMRKTMRTAILLYLLNLKKNLESSNKSYIIGYWHSCL